MDRTQTQLVVILAAITAGLVVTFEYLRWSHSRLKTQPVSLVAQTAAKTAHVTIHPRKQEESARQSQVDTSTIQSVVETTVETHTEKPKESSQESQNDSSAKPPVAETTTQPLGVPWDCNQGSQTDISANGPSMISRNKENRTILEARLIKAGFHVHCSCDSHTKELYFNWPYSCSAKHHEDDIVLQPNSRPTMLHEYEDGAYESLSLANRTIEYFSRRESTMDSDKLLPLLNGEEAASAPAFSKC